MNIKQRLAEKLWANKALAVPALAALIVACGGSGASHSTTGTTTKPIVNSNPVDVSNADKLNAYAKVVGKSLGFTPDNTYVVAFQNGYGLNPIAGTLTTDQISNIFGYANTIYPPDTEAGNGKSYANFIFTKNLSDLSALSVTDIGNWSLTKQQNVIVSVSFDPTTLTLLKPNQPLMIYNYTQGGYDETLGEPKNDDILVAYAPDQNFSTQLQQNAKNAGYVDSTGKPLQITLEKATFPDYLSPTPDNLVTDLDANKTLNGAFDGSAVTDALGEMTPPIGLTSPFAYEPTAGQTLVFYDLADYQNTPQSLNGGSSETPGTQVVFEVYNGNKLAKLMIGTAWYSGLGHDQEPYFYLQTPTADGLNALQKAVAANPNLQGVEVVAATDSNPSLKIPLKAKPAAYAKFKAEHPEFQKSTSVVKMSPAAQATAIMHTQAAQRVVIGGSYNPNAGTSRSKGSGLRL